VKAKLKIKRPGNVTLRRRWVINPTTQVKPSAREYARTMAKQTLRKELHDR